MRTPTLPMAALVAASTFAGLFSSTALAQPASPLTIDKTVAGTEPQQANAPKADRRAPRVRVLSTSARLARRATSVRIPILASERSRLDVRVHGGGRTATATRTHRAGRTRLAVPLPRSPRLMRALAQRDAAVVTVSVTATDRAGNHRTSRVPVTVLPPGNSGGGRTAGGVRLSWPVLAPVISSFGRRWGRPHQGLDFGAPSGHRVRAAARGRVTHAGWMTGFGKLVIVDHGRTETYYAHLSRISVRSGQLVRRGQGIGRVGSTGRSSGPHLHFEVHVGDRPKNPLRYLP